MVTDNTQMSNIDFDDLDQFGVEFASKEDLAKFLIYKVQFEDYNFLNMSGKPVVMKMYQDEADLRYEYSSIYDFKQFHKEEHFMVVGRKSNEKRYFADLWLEDATLRTRYDSCVFDPSGKNVTEKTFNFWKGFVEPIKGDISKFLKHIDLLISGSKEQKEYLIKRIAYEFRFPHIQTGTSIALRGPQGAGKTTISMCIQAMCPNHCKVIDDIEDLFGFNSETLHTKFFFMEEAVWGGNKSSEGKLKNAITATMRNIRIKNITGTTVKNYAFYVFTSNEDWMVPVGPGDRRFSVFDCTSNLEAIPSYFDDFYAWLNGEGKHALLYYFLNEIDLEGFNPKKPIETQAKTDLKTLSLKPVEKFIFNLLSGEIDYDPLDNDGWAGEVRLTRSDLYNYFLENTSTNRVEQGEFSRKLAAVFDFVPNWKDNWKDKKHGGFYKLPCKKECMIMFAKFLKEDTSMLFPGCIEALDGIEANLHTVVPEEIVFSPAVIKKVQTQTVEKVVLKPVQTPEQKVAAIQRKLKAAQKKAEEEARKPAPLPIPEKKYQGMKLPIKGKNTLTMQATTGGAA